MIELSDTETPFDPSRHNSGGEDDPSAGIEDLGVTSTELVTLADYVLSFMDDLTAGIEAID